MRLDAVVVTAIGALAALLWGMYRRAGPGEVWLPPELRGARLVYTERLFRTGGPTSISARVDRVYCSAAGALVLVELKTRVANRTYLSDVIELSAQRLAVMAETGSAVSNYAFVLTEWPDGRKTGCHRVMLIPHIDLLALATRRQDLLAGVVEPRPTCSPGMCRKCTFFKQCAS